MTSEPRTDPPRHDAQWYHQLTWAIAAAALVVGLLAWALEGTARALLLVAAMALALGVARITALHELARRDGELIGGSGYVVPRSPRVQLLHLFITALYVSGIAVGVFAVLVRAGVPGLAFPPAAVQAFPIALGVLVALLATACVWRVHEQGGVVAAWYTRVHGWILFAVAAPALVAGLWLALVGQVSIAGGTLVTETNILLLALLVVLGSATHVFLAVNLPTVFDFGTAVVRLFRGQEERVETGTPPLVYAGLIAVGGAAILGFMLSRFDVAGGLGEFGNDRIALLVLLIPVALGLFFASSALQLLREKRRSIYTKRIPTKLRNDLMVYGASAVLGITFSILLVLNLLGQVERIGPIPGGRTLSKDLVMATIVTSFGPIGFYLHKESRRVDNIESRLPDFLNDLAETRRAGLTLPAALQAASFSDYGALSHEIRKMAHQVAWGIPFAEALRQFAARVPTSLIKRVSYLIIEATKTGGSVAEILKAAAKDAYELKALESERRVTMTTYLIVIYVIFFVFMTVIAVLDTRFIPQVMAANAVVEESGREAFGSGIKLDRETMNFVYFNAAVVQAVGNGMVAGVLAEARITAGFRHVAIMTLAAWVVFRVLIVV